MEKLTLNKLLLIGCLLVMVSCKAKKLVIAAAPQPGAPVTQPVQPAPYADNGRRGQLSPPDGMAATTLNPALDKIQASQLTFNTFSGRADGSIDIDGDKNNVSLNIHIGHDKKIWVSVSATLILTVEVARVVITPDSIMMIDKLHGTYLKKPFSYIYQYANDQVSYKMLEALLTGNAIPAILKDYNATVQTDNVVTTISGSMVQMIYSLMVGQNMRPARLNLSDHNAGQSMQVINSGTIQAGNKNMPSQIDIQSTAQNKKIQVNLRYTKVELDQPLQYPFNIPDSYKPVD